MDGRFHGLHPLHRFKLLQQQEEEETENSSPLPAKKRKESWPSFPLLPITTTTYCLPAKKRVCAVQPLLFTPDKPIQPFDLNLEYEPSPKKNPHLLQKKLNLSNIVEAKEKKKEVIGEGDDDDDDGIVCDICQSTDGDASDPIVFCDGCDLMVHATCYGNPLIWGIPEGDWFCAKCQVSSSPLSRKEIAVDEIDASDCCCLCPVKGGAMKLTTDGRWAHILCALFVPEVFFKDPEGREDIDCSRVPHRRWERICYICNSVSGCAIDCSEPKCLLAFHVTCGLKEDLCIEYREGRSGSAIVAGFCKTHTELWKKQQQTGKFKIVARDKEEHKKLN